MRRRAQVGREGLGCALDTHAAPCDCPCAMVQLAGPPSHAAPCHATGGGSVLQVKPAPRASYVQPRMPGLAAGLPP